VETSRSRLKSRLEDLANLAIVAVGIVVAVQAVRTWTGPTPGGRAPTPPLRVYEPGEQLPKLGEIDFTRAERTVVLALRKGCSYCERSMPFYRKLRSSQKQMLPGVQVVVVSSDSVDVSREYLASHQLDVDAIATSRELKVPGTPSVIFADRQGKVTKVWVGLLDLAKQQELWDALTP